jgi:hypothetical protein
MFLSDKYASVDRTGKLGISAGCLLGLRIAGKSNYIARTKGSFLKFK